MEGSVSAATIGSTLADILPAADNGQTAGNKQSTDQRQGQGVSLALAEDEYSKAAAGKGRYCN